MGWRGPPRWLRGVLWVFCASLTLASASPAAGAATTVSQNTSTTTTAANSISCADTGTGFHEENGYLRRFHLPDHGIAGAFVVSDVTFGIELADDAGGLGQPVSVRLYGIAAAAPLTTGNLALIASQDITVADSEATLRTVSVSGTITDPGATDLVIEILTPDGTDAGHSFLIGSNSGGETQTSYIRAPACGLNEPTTPATLGSPGMHIVLLASGDPLVVSPPPAPPAAPAPPAPPETILGKHPRKIVRTRRATAKVTFGFSSPTLGASFQYKIDRAPFRSCASPRSYRLKPGRHTFRVRAKAASGTDPTPATFPFRIRRRPS
jgi:hypothetical protein